MLMHFQVYNSPASRIVNAFLTSYNAQEKKTDLRELWFLQYDGATMKLKQRVIKKSELTGPSPQRLKNMEIENLVIFSMMFTSNNPKSLKLYSSEIFPFDTKAKVIDDSGLNTLRDKLLDGASRVTKMVEDSKGQVFEDSKTANVNSVFKKDKKEDPGNYQPVNISSVPGEVMEHLILKNISVHMDDRKVISSSEHGYTKGKSCLVDLIAFYDEATTWMDEGRVVDIALT
ncbi:hypothetical protein BTVI_71919 [Pitangus sulphuratus]|nr:hypothetical protein BTVI_71919 [Pitangus sulphuratus]